MASTRQLWRAACARPEALSPTVVAPSVASPGKTSAASGIASSGTVPRGGRYLARGGLHEVLEGDWEPHRLVVLEFPDMASLKAWYDSPEYAPIKQIRENSAEGRLIALEGL
jgi:uncharacterized protein (DUF1330 family)